MNANFDWPVSQRWGYLIGLSQGTLKGFMGFIQMRFEVNSSLSVWKKRESE